MTPVVHDREVFQKVAASEAETEVWVPSCAMIPPGSVLKVSFALGLLKHEYTNREVWGNVCLGKTLNDV